MKTKISYSYTEIGTVGQWEGVPYFELLTQSQKDELDKTTMVTITEDARIISLSAVEMKIKSPEEK